MKKFYEAPELEMIRITMQDVLGGSKEGEIGSQIIGDDDYDDDLEGGGL